MQTKFDNFDASVRTYLSKIFNQLGESYSQSKIFGIIFDGVKGIMQNILFYIEDALTEQNIFKATRKQSVYSLAKISGYEASYGSAATGILLGKMKRNNEFSNSLSKIYIKNGTQILNRATGITYSLYIPTEFYVFDVFKPLMTHEFKIIQGIMQNANYVATGRPLETIHIYSTDLFDKNYITVTVDGEKWTQVGNIYDMSEDSKEYMISIGFDNTFDVTFGNGVHGKQLREGQTIIIKYLLHSGTYGNIQPSESSDFVFAEMSYDSLGNGVNANDYMQLSVRTCISGGVNSDSIDFIRSTIGSNSRSNVIASEDNFNLFFKKFSFIGMSNCWSEPNSMTVTATCLSDAIKSIKNIDDYYNLDTSKLLLDDSQKIMIQETLENSKKAFAGITLNFKDPIIRKFAVMVYVKVDNDYNKELVSNKIKESFAKYFINLKQNQQFISKSDIIQTLMNDIENIVSIDFDFISDLNETAYYNGYYNKYELVFVNGRYTYVEKKIMYEKNSNIGLDIMGNISLDSKLEIPFLHGGFNYYPNKSDNDKNAKNTMIKIDAVSVFFVS